jgi:hypothetical protein
MKKILVQLLYLLGFVILFYFSYTVDQWYMKEKTELYQIYPGIFYFSLTFVVIGLYFGLPHLLKTIKLSGTFVVNKSKLIIFVLPTLYFTLYPVLNFETPFLVIHNLVFNQFVFSSEFINFSSFFFGAVLISSFEKKQ